MEYLRQTLLMIVVSYAGSAWALDCSTTYCKDWYASNTSCHHGVTTCDGSKQVCFKHVVTTGSVFTTTSRGCISADSCQNGCETKENSLECYESQNATDYRGMVSITQSNKRCLPWNVESKTLYPDAGLNHNYCRNPNGLAGAWCYFSTTTKGVHVRNFCNISKPGQHCALKSETCIECCDIDHCNGASTPSLTMILILLNVVITLRMCVC
ncbi:uncharacterized protein LOC144441167 [Glandiceps talaboti]